MPVPPGDDGPNGDGVFHLGDGGTDDAGMGGGASDGGDASEGGNVVIPDAGDAGPVAVCGDGTVQALEACDPGENSCCADDCSGPIDAGELCRASKGDCDLAEHCDGDHVDCPADAKVDDGTECREAETDCDAAEKCDGVHPDCPDDEVAADSVECREAVDACDASEHCDGTTPTCPVDLPNHCAVSVLGTTLPLAVTGNTTSTCAVYGSSCDTSGVNANEQVFVYNATSTKKLRFDTYGSTYDTLISIREGRECAASEIDCADATVGLNESVTVTLLAGQSVLVVVDGYGGATGGFHLNVRDATPLDVDWTCTDQQYGGADGCDCGCGVLDPDCGSADSSECDHCGSCFDQNEPCADSANIHPTDNSQCSGWTCPSDYFYAGDGCDCGCGLEDPDCLGSTNDACDFCAACGDATFSCGGSASVSPTDTAVCAATWTCNPAWYGAGPEDGCDCGCGIVDPDCENATSFACDFCSECGDTATPCSGSAAVDPNNNAHCAPMTAVWTCDMDFYGTMDGCDCGCGIVDPDCASAASSACEFCGACKDGTHPCAGSAAVVADDNARCQ